MRKKKTEAEEPGDSGAPSAWNSPRCTRPKCRTTLDFGAGIQFLGDKGGQQRYCWPDWVKYNNDPKRFPGVVEVKDSKEGL
jgi:hypothetical protein